MPDFNEELYPLAKRTSFLVFLGGVLATYSHFAGYTFLKGFLSGLGLGSIEFSLTPLESVFQTSQFLRQLTKNLISDLQQYFTMGWLPFVVFSVVGGWYVWFVTSASKKTKKTSTQTQPLKWYQKMFVFPCFFGAGVTSVLMAILFMLGMSSQIFLLAFERGKDSAFHRLSNDVCISLSEVKERQKNKKGDELSGRRAGCSVLQDASGNKLTGVVLFQSKEMKVFMTNAMAILFNNKDEIITCAPIVEITNDETIESSEKSANPCHSLSYTKPTLEAKKPINKS